jgi:hypothetical protein
MSNQKMDGRTFREKDSRVKHENDNNTTYYKKKSFRHCERSAAVHFLDCHVALLLAMTKQEELVAFFTDIQNLLLPILQKQFCNAKLELSDNKHSLLNCSFTDINSKFRAIQFI